MSLVDDRHPVSRSTVGHRQTDALASIVSSCTQPLSTHSVPPVQRNIVCIALVTNDLSTNGCLG